MRGNRVEFLKNQNPEGFDKEIMRKFLENFWKETLEAYLRELEKGFFLRYA